MNKGVQFEQTGKHFKATKGGDKIESKDKPKDKNRHYIYSIKKSLNIIILVMLKKLKEKSKIEMDTLFGVPLMGELSFFNYNKMRHAMLLRSRKEQRVTVEVKTA